MKKIICDLCNKEINMKTPYMVSAELTIWINYGKEKPIHEDKYDLCKDCCEEIVKRKGIPYEKG